jgi:glycerate dehydrogenase
MNIIAIDCGRLAGEAEFPEIDCPKYGWVQYPELPPDQVPERCWRSDIIITVNTPVDRTVIDQALKLKLIAVAGDSYGHVDLAAARERGIEVCNVPGLDPGDPGATRQICAQVIENINAFLQGEAKNLV